MPEIVIKDSKNKDAGKLSLSDDLYGIKDAEGLIHSSVVNHLANQRQGTHATKTKGMVSGGGIKPYKQKGTGRARQGSTRSPLIRGGGTTFGPLPRDYSYSMPRKARLKAFFSAMSAKIADGEVVVVDELKLSSAKTKLMADVLGKLGLDKGSVLLVLGAMDDKVALAARNIPGVNLKMAGDINAYDVLSHSKVLITKDAFEALDKRGQQ